MFAYCIHFRLFGGAHSQGEVHRVGCEQIKFDNQFSRCEASTVGTRGDEESGRSADRNAVQKFYFREEASQRSQLSIL
jgi:hypothetical protein